MATVTGQGASVGVAGIPFEAGFDSDGQYATLTSQYVRLNEAPLHLYIVPPVAGIGDIPIGDMIKQLVDAIQAGAVIVGLG